MERDKMKVENPEESIGDITRLLALKWKALTKEEKKVPFNTLSADTNIHPSIITIRSKRKWKNMKKL